MMCVVATVGVMAMVAKIVPAVTHGVVHTFIATMSIVVMMMHPDADAVWAHNHCIRHGAGREERGGKGN
jgi:hypothetical protein